MLRVECLKVKKEDFIVKRVKLFKIVLVVCLFMVLSSMVVLAEQPKEPEKTFKLRWHTANIPLDAHTKAMYVFRDVIENITDGQIKVDIFHSSSLYPQDQELNALLRGDIEMIYMSAHGLTRQMPYLTMLTAGYFWQSYEHLNKVMNGEIGKEIFDDIADKMGFRPLGAFYLGARNINVRDIGRDIRTPEDLKGVNLRMASLPAWLFLGKALIANPTTLHFGELYLALSTGTIDGQDNPLPTVFIAKFYMGAIKG